MGTYQRFRGNSENKLFYLIDGLYGGINTEYSDDVSQNGEFRDIVNFELDKRGCLSKRKGFGKLSAISQILNLLGAENLPEVRLKTEDYTNPENTNDNIIYMKLLQNDNNCFRNLSAFNEDKGYRKYQEMYGFQNNEFKLFMITTNVSSNTSTAWLIKCKLPKLQFDESGNVIDTIETSIESELLKVVFPWDRNLVNVDTLEYFNKIYFLENNSGIMVYNRASETLSEGITYGGFYIHNGESYDLENGAYKPTGLEVSNVGFNVLGGDKDKSPLYWIDTTELDTNSIQGLVLLSDSGVPLKSIPYSTNFKIAIIYTGTIPGEKDLFTIELKSSVDNLDFNTNIQITATYNEELSVNNSLAVYDIVMPVVTETFIQIKATKTDSNIDPLYAYYSVSKTGGEDLPVERLSLEGYKVIDFYSRALYYKDNLLWFSDLNNFTYIPHYNRFELPLEPTDKIVKIVFFRNVHIIFTRYKIYKIYGNDPFASDFSITILNDSLGCCAANSVIQIENVIYFASDRGLYQLVSNYISSNAMTFENVKELDDKVKTLTSNFTYKIGAVEDDLSMRYNGISDKAAAIRYKDKYLLFYNTSFEKGDYAAENNIDVLVYNYDLKAYTTNRFLYKPTFLFMVDNAIETFATYPEKPVYDSEETILSYDLENSAGSNIIDLTGNGNDATISEGVVLSPGAGVELNGESSYISVDAITGDASEGLTIELDTQCSEAKESVLFDLTQTIGGSESQIRGAIEASAVEDDYKFKLKLEYVSTPDFARGVSNIEYKVTLINESGILEDITNSDCSFTLKDGLNTLISKDKIMFSLPKDVNSLVLDSGEFTVEHDANGVYEQTWTLEFSAGRNYSETTYIKGSNKSGTVAESTNAGSWTKIGFAWAAVPNDGFCRVTFSKVYFQNNDTIYQNYKRNLIITVDKTNLSFPIPAFSTIGKHYSTTTSKYVDIVYSDGSHKVDVSAKYNLVGTLGGVSYDYLVMDDINPITLPSITKKVTDTIRYMSGDISVPIELTQIVGSGTRLTLRYDDVDDALIFNLTSGGSSIEILTSNDIEFLGIHKWKIELDKSVCKIYKDGEVITTSDLYNYPLTKLVLTSNFLGVDKNFENYLNGSIYGFRLSSPAEVLVEYNFTEGVGTSIKDTSGNEVLATLIDCTWIIEKGCAFTGNDSFLALGVLPTSINFTNGFMIEFDMECENVLQDSRILDFAKGYDIQGSGNHKCSIAIGLKDGNIYLTSTGLSGNKFELINKLPIDLQRHNYKFTVVDDGTGYAISLYIDEEIQPNTLNTSYKTISNTNRESNFIGRSNIVGQKDFEGLLYNLIIKTYESSSAITYSPAIFEYDTSHSEFDRPMSYLIRTKGYNLDYPQHLKKLKKIFIKLIGGYNYGEVFFIAYCDGFMANDPTKYVAKLNPDGTITYETKTEANLKVEATASKLDSLELNKSKLGETIYQLDKFDIRTKCKNISMEFYGESSDSLEIESIGIVCKLGKVKN